jgi:hypothetical protein
MIEFLFKKKIDEQFLLKDEEEKNKLYIISEFMKKISKNKIKKLQINPSYNGSKIFFVSPEVDYIFQNYLHLDDIKNILTVMNTFKAFSNIKYKVAIAKDYNGEKWSRKNKIEYSIDTVLDYDIFDYVVKFNKNYNILKIIEWEKITPITDYKKYDEFISKNILKICWDISKALHGIHSRGYIHGNPLIENIGVNKNGNFVLFDFDKMIVSNEIKKDYDKFTESFAEIIDPMFIPVDLDIKNVLIFYTGNGRLKKTFDYLEYMVIKK